MSEAKLEPPVNVVFAAEMYRFVQEIAAKRGVSETDIIEEALGLERYYQRALEEGARMIIERKDGSVWELQRPFGEVVG